MKRNTCTKLLALSLSAGLSMAPPLAVAEDIDIFTGMSSGNLTQPRILIVLDNTSNWSRQSQQWPDGAAQGKSEVNAISRILPELDANIHLGLMEYVTGGNASDDGGFIRYPVLPMAGTPNTTGYASSNKGLLDATLTTIGSGITSPTEKRNANTPYGNLMYDVYSYFSGGSVLFPAATEGSPVHAGGYTSAYTTYNSPLVQDSTCGKSFVIFIGNPNQSGPAADSAANTTLLNTVNGNLDSNNQPIPVNQLGLPNFTSQPVTTKTQVGVTDACFASPAAAATVLGAEPFTSACARYSEGCAIGNATVNSQPLVCPSGTQTYTVIQSVYTPASGGSGGSTSQGTPVPSSSLSNGYYGSAADVPATDRGSLVCPAGGNGTSYSCTYSVGAASGSNTPVVTSGLSASCYQGTGTGTDAWNPATSTDRGGLSCPANSTCTYSGVSQNKKDGCDGSARKIEVTQTATPLRRFTINQSATPTFTSGGSGGTPESTVTNTLGPTSQCYAAPPAGSTGDYASSCSGTNISCTYGNAPTATTIASCPAGSSVYSVIGTNTVVTNVATGTTSTDTNPYNADEWARLMHDRGIQIGTSAIRPSVTTYTIDVYNAQPDAAHTSLMMSMAKAGGGKYFAAKNEQAILDALKEIMIEIQAINSAFASTSLPVNATNRSQTENQVFIGMFRPDPVARPRWFGNLKRYKLKANGAEIDLADVNGNPAVNNVTGFVTPCAQSYWTADSGSYWSGKGVNPDPAGTCTLNSSLSKYSDAPDGPLVEKGAVAQVLRFGNVGGGSTASQVVSRNMYTFKTNSFVTFSAANSGLPENQVRFIRGEDVENDQADGTPTTTSRPSIHGDVIHSRPRPVNYGGTTGVVVFYGANDGTFRSVNAATGVERWSLVAPEFFTRLSRLQDNSPLINYPVRAGSTPIPGATAKDYFFDGSTGVYQSANLSTVWVFPAMRRGGRMLYGIDASNPDLPVFKWRAGCPNLADDTGCTTGMSDIGQTWSTPNVAFIKGYGKTNPVILVGGGYDSCEDLDSKTSTCSSPKGGAVYVLDAATGERLAMFPTTRSVVADIAMTDIDNDGAIDYAYAADTGGKLYRIDFIDSPVTRGELDRYHWKSRQVAATDVTAGRKFLFAPSLLASRGSVYVAIGSGDRERPLAVNYPYRENVTNRFYVYRDDLATATGSVDLDGATVADYTNTDACDTPQILPGSGLAGWRMDLTQYGKGEQTVTSGLIVSGLVTFSTNRPVTDASASCSTSLGQARGYWVNLLNGSGAINVSGTCGGSRAAVFTGGGLPPTPVIASSVDVDGKSVTVVFGAPAKGDDSGKGLPPGEKSAMDPDPVKPAIKSKRKRAYSYTSGD